MPRASSIPDRLQSIADVLRLPVEVFFDEPVSVDGTQEHSTEYLRLALISAAEAYSRSLYRKAQSVSLAGQN